LLTLAEGDQVYEAAPKAFNVILWPAHILAELGAEVILIVGVGITFTVTTVEPTQPSGDEPLTLYIVVVFGLAFGFAIPVALKLGEGVQVYELAPLTLNPAELPEQMVGLDAGVIIGLVVGVTTTWAVFVHVPVDPITVYVVLNAGVASTTAPVLLLNVKVGVQV
jgi:hypothetical protein